MSNTMIWLIIGLAIVTYIPRMVPLVFLNSDKIPSPIQNVLKNVPFAILGALIFPGILTINDDLMFGVIGAVAAIVAAYLGANLIIVVMFAVAVLSTYAYFI
ncbi:AzlD domain-containing protein [Bacillus sp. RAR_GA_16]|uniref:AzlD domain-containing protein n=1 Tax=Bacillus sp. RAR_GA_16 TaxID=2876774 RepID=UPI001CCFABE1|nr:AzlD domain-containing protein [Bacillus sp. RAR_GA_16]MCA0173405.1 AzlD domain-containing protein [Bacillus sp. RAR_GA_16]